MREIALVAVGVIAGGFIGVTFMCLFQINKGQTLYHHKKGWHRK